jgi:hypothetical protein
LPRFDSPGDASSSERLHRLGRYGEAAGFPAFSRRLCCERAYGWGRAMFVIETEAASAARKMSVVMIIAVALMSSPVPAEDAAKKRVDIYISGTELTHDCRSFLITHRTGVGTAQQQAEQSRCYGYVTGVFDLATELVAQGHITLPFCIPKGSNANDLTEVVAKFADENPAQRNQSGAGIVSAAWVQAFPCQSKN